MADNELEIGINLAGRKSGVDAEAELAAVREQIKGATDDTKEYDAWLQKNAASLGQESQALEEAAAAAKKLADSGLAEEQQILAHATEDSAIPALESFSQSSKVAAENLEKTGLSAHSLRMAFHLMPGPIREVGYAIRLLMQNELVMFIGLIAAAAKGFYTLATEAKKRSEETAKAVEEGAEKSRAAWYSQMSAMSQLSEKGADWSEKLREIGQHEKTWADELREGNEQLDERQRLLGQADDAQTKYQLAMIRLKESTGEMSKAEAIRQRYLIEQGAEQRKQDLEAETKRLKIDSVQQAIFNAQQQSGGLAAGVASALGASVSSERSIRIEELMGKGAGGIESKKTSLGEAEKAERTARDAATAAGKTFMEASPQWKAKREQQWKEALATLEFRANVVRNIRTGVSQMIAEADALKSEQSRADASLKEAQAKLIENNKTIETLKAELLKLNPKMTPEMISAQGLAKSGAAGAAVADYTIAMNAAGGLNAGMVEHTLRLAAQGAAHASLQSPMSHEEASAYKDFEALKENRGLSFQAILDHLKEINKNEEQFRAELGRLGAR